MKRIFLILLSVLAISACTEDVYTSEEGSQEPGLEVGSSSDLITFSIETMPISRADIVEDVSEMESFSLFAYRTDAGYLLPAAYGSEQCSEIMDNVKYSYVSDGVWSCDTEATWDYDDVADRFSFFAISPYVAESGGVYESSEVTVSSSGAKLIYRLPQYLDYQTDLMISNRMNILRPQAGVVSLDFTHALAAIQLTVLGRDDVGAITLKGYGNQGTLDLMTGEWSDVSNTNPDGEQQVISGTDISNSDEDAIADMVTKTTDDGYILMIPQVVVEETTYLYNEEEVILYSSPEDIDFVIVITSDGTRTDSDGKSSIYDVEVSLGESIDAAFELEGGKLYNFVYRSATLNNGVIDLSNYDSTVGSEEEAEAIVEGLIAELEAYDIDELTFTGTYNQYILGAFSDAGFVITYDLSGMTYDDAYWFEDDGSIGGDIGVKIHAGVFQGDTYVQSIILPEGLSEINTYAFAGCTNLKTVIFSEGTTLSKISQHVFIGCSSLTTIEIPNTVEYIQTGAFYGCTNLTYDTTTRSGFTFESGSSLESITNYAFGNSGLTETLVSSSFSTTGGGTYSDLSVGTYAYSSSTSDTYKDYN